MKLSLHNLIISAAAGLCFFAHTARAQAIGVVFEKKAGAFALAQDGIPAAIRCDSSDHPGVLLAAEALAKDIEKVAGAAPQVVFNAATGKHLAAATLGSGPLAESLLAAGGVDRKELEGKREKFILHADANSLFILGSDARGTIYGIYELSRRIGVSPWHYWADVPIEAHKTICVLPGSYTEGEPAVRYRGIFLNDEAPSLTGWVKANFGKYDHRFYQKVFELLLRLKGNFLWPAMWDAAFYDDDPQNSVLADRMGIVMGTSHHEPMARAHKEWGRYGTGPWNYQTNQKTLDGFWRAGINRMKHTQDVVTIGMRGDGDEPMSEQSNIALLKKIVADQRRIIEKETGKPSSSTPQVWALYKEVQEYYDKGMEVPEDVTLLLCDDNWGNVRRLPAIGASPRKGGYGMYYHFDYVGGPRSYKWLNVSQVQRVWEQMDLCWRHGVDRMWIVNVGDLKPMEYPIQFFLDMAWDPSRFNPGNLMEHTRGFCAEQFGEKHAEEAARILNLYSKYNARVTPELLNEKTYPLGNYDEFNRVTTDYLQLETDALRLYHLLPASYRDAFDQLVLFPVQACANLYAMYYAVAMNRELYGRGDAQANLWADRAGEHFKRDSMLCRRYNREISGGKWNHMMDQTHIGYTYWNQPPKNTMPEVRRLPRPEKQTTFAEADGYVSIEAGNFARKGSAVEYVAGLGRTCGALIFRNGEDAWVEYDALLTSSGTAKLTLLLSPTLDFNGRGLRYGVQIGGQPEQIVNFNGKYDDKLQEKWQAQRIIASTTEHNIAPGPCTIRIRLIDPGVVLQKLTLDTGGLKPSYLAPPQSETVKTQR